MTMADVDGIAAVLALGMAALAFVLFAIGYRFPDIAGPRWWAAGAGMMVVVAVAWHWGGDDRWVGFLRSPLFIASLLVQAWGLVRFAGRGAGGELALITLLGLAVGLSRHLLPHGSDVWLLVASIGLAGALGAVSGLAWRLGTERDLFIARMAALLAAAGACFIALCFSVAMVGAPLAHALDETAVKGVIVAGLQALFLPWLGCLAALAWQAASLRRRAAAASAAHDDAVVTIVRRGRARAANASCVRPPPPHCRRADALSARPLVLCRFRPPSRRCRLPG